jgi:nucleoside-diphosphate-sugar epimerase
MNSKKILVMGGTGAMGVYQVPELIEMDYQVDVVSLNKIENTYPHSSGGHNG